MTDQNTNKKVATNEQQNQITPLRCLTGGSISGVLALGAYFLMTSVVTTYATKPITFSNQMAVSIATMVRTLTVGITALATFVFGLVTVGLGALAVKLIIEQGKIPKSSD
jgi:polyferredoxin